MPNRDNIINPTMVSVINLDSSVTDSDLYDLFITAGEVIWSEIRTHRYSGLSLGYGYVSYTHAEHGMYLNRSILLFYSSHNLVFFPHVIRFFRYLLAIIFLNFLFFVTINVAIHAFRDFVFIKRSNP